MFSRGDKVRVFESGATLFAGRDYTVASVERERGNEFVYLEEFPHQRYRISLFISIPKNYIVIDQDGYSRTFDLLESAIKAAKTNASADIYELGRKLEKKTVVTWE